MLWTLLRDQVAKHLRGAFQKLAHNILHPDTLVAELTTADLAKDPSSAPPPPSLAIIHQAQAS